jgi:uncharacterized protein (DUF1778 family)
MSKKQQAGRTLISVSVPSDVLPTIRSAIALTGESTSSFFYNAALDRAAAEIEQAARNGMPLRASESGA